MEIPRAVSRRALPSPLACLEAPPIGWGWFAQGNVKNGVPKNPQTIEEWFEYSEALKADKRPKRASVSPTPDVDLSILLGVGCVAPSYRHSNDPDARFESYGGYGGARAGRPSVSQGGE